ncbi:uncharacterized protein A4U43_C03F17980 [Asparagus officinalis]|uniref:Pectinesterase inhibitor domain-containing protein n=1 Tax=Asparagus officinalis TaxID=4686 RepID=A0A5P1FFY6_ASPOF|nr:uncharacterized protein LOC109832245 [Asparagus officinalis]ONK75541.1 uncharacterized protein A4U43_C03F17980 [Asparagus officinalis]
MKVFASISAAFLLLNMYSVGATLLEETCKNLTSPPIGPARGFDFEFCKTSLQVAPGSEKADAIGLTIIAANIALVNFTHNKAKATELLQDKNLSKQIRRILTECQSIYSEDAVDLKKAIDALKSGKFDRMEDVINHLGKAADDVLACRDGWEFSGQKSLMPKEEENAEKLSELALAVASLLPSPPSPGPSFFGF